MNKLLQAAIQDREAYEKIKSLLSEKDLGPMDVVVFEYVERYYTKDEQATSVDTTLIIDKLKRLEKRNPAMGNVISYLSTFEPVSVPNLVEEIIEQRKDRISNEIVKNIGLRRFDLVDKSIEEYQQLRSVEEEKEDDVADQEFVGLPLDFMVKGNAQENCITLYPKSLNTAVDGRAKRGHHIGIAATPETGKTLFVLNLVACWCNDGHKVLYIGNEDPLEDIAKRLSQRFTLKPLEWIEQNVAEAERISKEHGSDNLILIGMSPGTPREIEKKIIEHTPDILVVDQIRNIETGGEGNTVVLEEGGKFARRMAKQHHLLAVTVTQAADSATNHVVLDRSHLADSKIGYPAQLDLLIMLGKNEQYEQFGQVCVSLKGKNKLSGKHVYFPVNIDTTYNRVRDAR